MSVGVASAFVDASRAHLIGEYIPKIRRCLGELDPPDIWWRPNEASNAVGNLVLHLSGNATQWILHGILGQPDVRKRDEEFAVRDASMMPDLYERVSGLEADLEDGFRTIAELCAGDPGYLSGTRVIQGLEVTVLEALYHVVEHFAQHTGQIMYVTKVRTGGDLRFWDVREGIASPNW